MMRLDKFLSETLSCTRSEVKSFIKQKKITVNNIIITKPEYKIEESTDIVCFNGKILQYVGLVYYMLHKPAGYISSTSDEDGPSVLRLLKDAPGKDLFPVGRLDKDTEGLLLITNDGAMAHELLSPKKHVDKTYFAVIDHIVTEDDITLFQNGLDIGEKKSTMPALLKIIKSDVHSEVFITIKEGKYHQIKRMFQAVGKKVIYLKRISMGSLVLDENLKPGDFRELSKDELDNLFKDIKRSTL